MKDREAARDAAESGGRGGEDAVVRAERHALVVEGGAMRGIFSAGILDSFIRAGYYPFSDAYGVSAGSSNVAAYLAGMEGRNYRVYSDYMRRRPFIRPLRFLTGGHYMDLDWLWDITKAEVPLDVAKIVASPVDHRVVVTRSDTGEAEYLRPEYGELVELLKASSAVPVLYRGYPQIRSTPYSDGGIADPIPAEQAWRDGCSSITVLRSRPYEYMMEEQRPNILTRLVLRNRPALYEALARRHALYNAEIAFLRNPPQGCKIREINPPPELGLERLTLDTDILDATYKAGEEAGREYIDTYSLTPDPG